MISLNSRITWLEKTHLTDEFVSAFLDRTLTYDFSWRSVVKYLSKFDIRISSVFIRLILPVFFFEAVSCTENV